MADAMGYRSFAAPRLFFRQTLRGSITFRALDPRLAEPRPGLNSDRCSAALFRDHVQRWDL